MKSDLSSSNRPELRKQLDDLLVAYYDYCGEVRVSASPPYIHADYSKVREKLAAIEAHFQRLQSENERLKETALTGNEVGMVIYALENSVSLYPEASPWPPIIKKLRSGTS